MLCVSGVLFSNHVMQHCKALFNDNAVCATAHGRYGCPTGAEGWQTASKAVWSCSWCPYWGHLQLQRRIGNHRSAQADNERHRSDVRHAFIFLINDRRNILSLDCFREYGLKIALHSLWLQKGALLCGCTFKKVNNNNKQLLFR